MDPDKDDDFWIFSFEEMGDYDLPAQVEKVLSVSGQSTVAYVGHS